MVQVHRTYQLHFEFRETLGIKHHHYFNPSIDLEQCKMFKRTYSSWRECTYDCQRQCNYVYCLQHIEQHHERQQLTRQHKDKIDKYLGDKPTLNCSWNRPIAVTNIPVMSVRREFAEHGTSIPDDQSFQLALVTTGYSGRCGNRHQQRRRTIHWRENMYFHSSCQSLGHTGRRTMDSTGWSKYPNISYNSSKPAI